MSGGAGKDSNPGTAEKPVQTISKAIAIAAALGGKQSVYIAASHYTEKVTLEENVDLLGGYQCDASACTWSRDVQKNDTVVQDVDFEGVLAPKTVTKKTLVDGLHIVGKEGVPSAAPGGVALTISGGTPRIVRCRIEAGQTNGGPQGGKRSIAVALLGPMVEPEGATIDQNVILGGGATEESVAVLFDQKPGSTNAVATATVTGNIIRGGDASITAAVGVLASSPKSLLHDNAITAGSATNGGGNSASWGVAIGSAITVDGNRINLVQANVGTCSQNGAGNFCGGIVSRGSTATLTNNIVFGVKGPRSAAVLLTDGEGGVGDVIVNANYLDGAGNGGADTTFSAAIALYLNQGNTGTFGKVRNNILLGGTNKNRYGVYEEQMGGKTAHLAAIENNDFWNAGTPKNDFAYRTWNGAATADVTFAQLSTVTTPTPTANIASDPLVDASFHLAPNSPCINKGTLTEAPGRDIDGDQRPKGNVIDIGPDEAK